MPATTPVSRIDPDGRSSDDPDAAQKILDIALDIFLDALAKLSVNPKAYGLLFLFSLLAAFEIYKSHPEAEQPKSENELALDVIQSIGRQSNLPPPPPLDNPEPAGLDAGISSVPDLGTSPVSATVVAPGNVYGAELVNPVASAIKLIAQLSDSVSKHLRRSLDPKRRDRPRRLWAPRGSSPGVRSSSRIASSSRTRRPPRHPPRWSRSPICSIRTSM